jgi:hypothetical protein
MANHFAHILISFSQRDSMRILYEILLGYVLRGVAYFLLGFQLGYWGVYTLHKLGVF